MKNNVDLDVINDFGDEWKEYSQDKRDKELKEIFKTYFSLFPSKYLSKSNSGFDAGCGSGRWAKYIAPKVANLHCIDASVKAIEVTKQNLSGFDNCTFECVSINESKLKDDSMDFGYSLGVLHHLPDTLSAMKSCVSKLKKDSPFLLYLYYKFDNKPIWFKLIWKISDYLRRYISYQPFKIKLLITKAIALLIYFPLARLSLILERIGIDIRNIPLSEYRNKSFYVMITDSLDRFGTKLEKRFTKNEIKKMMIESGLYNIKFRDNSPFWIGIGYKK